MREAFVYMAESWRKEKDKGGGGCIEISDPEETRP